MTYTAARGKHMSSSIETNNLQDTPQSSKKLLRKAYCLFEFSSLEVTEYPESALGGSSVEKVFLIKKKSLLVRYSYTG